jgi:hypothetical protein
LKEKIYGHDNSRVRAKRQNRKSVLPQGDHHPVARRPVALSLRQADLFRPLIDFGGIILKALLDAVMGLAPSKG